MESNSAARWASPLLIILAILVGQRLWSPLLVIVDRVGDYLTLIELDTWTSLFWIIFTLRYARLLGHSIGYLCYRPAQIPSNPTYTGRDVTVIVPTVDPSNPDFRSCIHSILANKPAALIVVTVGSLLRVKCQRTLREVSHDFPDTRILVSAISEASKRRQVAHAMSKVKTEITILADDHVFWRSDKLIPSILAPFENVLVSVVGTKKRVVRTLPGKLTWPSIVNFIACNYLQRHNWELRANNAIDGGVFVVSGRTAAYRTRFLKEDGLLDRYCNEKFFFGLPVGDGQGLGPDDDNFLTREAMKRDWLIRFQDTEEATIETTLGDWPKFKGQLLRWARTTFRSNPVMIRDLTFIRRYPWSNFMVYWVGLVNFALFWDTAMIVSLVLSKDAGPRCVYYLLTWVFFTKMIKIIPHFLRFPSDILLALHQVTFAYVHSLIKLWALCTFWDCGWSGRNLDLINENSDRALNTSFYVVDAHPGQ
ncbi:nucleotide-diphospho-sugar transferase [Mariannaea sp. PMI_226]|nr:nucleotide-diphospho-sugar transferase [Mariannaea sp. PMI_226]